jgi:hypothetical protein
MKLLILMTFSIWCTGNNWTTGLTQHPDQFEYRYLKWNLVLVIPRTKSSDFPLIQEWLEAV